MIIDIEFGHVYVSESGVSDDSNLELLQATAEYAGLLCGHLQGQGHTVTTSALVDDYTCSAEDVGPAIELLRSLPVIPQAVYREGDFASGAEAMIERLKKKYVRRRTTGRTFLADGRDLGEASAPTQYGTLFDVLALAESSGAPPPLERFRFALNFNLDWGAPGEAKYSCALLAACWNAWRLGLIDVPAAKPVVGRSAVPVDCVVSVLPADYITVEASVRALFMAGGPDMRAALSRVRYVFV